MSEERVERRLAAILAADVAGYSRLMSEDEEGTLTRLKAIRRLLSDPKITEHRGRIVKTTGDGVLAEFQSVVDAMRCAVAVQRGMADRNAVFAPAARIEFRIGINLGDIIVDKDGDIYGDGVNVAARLEAQAEPGGIWISAAAYEQVRDRLHIAFEDMGEHRVKNITRPIRAYRVRLDQNLDVGTTAPSASVTGADRPSTAVLPFAYISNDPDGSRALLQLSLFGPVTLRCDGQEIRIKSLKLRGILGYIALSDSLVETRERLVGLLWSEAGEAQARAVLRQVIRELRDIFSGPRSAALRITSHEIGLARDAIEVDVWAVLHAAEAAEVHPLLLERPRLMDDLLVGLEDLDPAFRAWVLAKRQTLSDRLLRALEDLLSRDANEMREGRAAEAILNLDPTHEPACRRLMRIHATAGNTARALSTYNSLWNLLDKEYDTEPSAATQQLIAEIKMGCELDRQTQDLGTALPVNSRATEISEPRKLSPTPIVPSSGTRLLLALLPVDVRQVDPDKSHLVLGFRQLLIASLVRFREWSITDVSLPTPFAGQREVSGSYQIQMVAQQNGNLLQLTIMLKELDSDLYIWSDGFELSLPNWFDSQKRVVQRLAMALNVYLSAERLRRFSERPDISLGLYDKWLRCQTLVRTFNPQHWRRLTTQFSEIIAAAPGFVPAFCGLADMHSIEHIAHPGIFRERQRELKALELAREAVQLDPSDMHAHRCLAWAHAMARQYGQAELHIQVACDLNPSDSWTTISGALLFAFCGKMDRAAVLSHIALDMTLAPSRTHWAYQVDIQFLIGDYAAAIDASDRAQDVLWGVAAWRTAALAHLNRGAEAAAEAQRFLSRIRAHWFGSKAPTDEIIVKWLLHLYPIRRREDWERLRDGLRAAGLPTSQAEHYA